MYSSSLCFVTRKDERGEPLPEENRCKIFISYRKKDNLYGIRDRLIQCVLSAADCAVWYDDSLTAGVDYDEEISEAIRDSDVVILLLTGGILKSEYVWNVEVAQAIAQKKGIIPVALGISAADLATVEERLGHMQLLQGDCLYSDAADTDSVRRFSESLGRALQYFINGRDATARVNGFFAAEKHLLPSRVLSLDQMYLLSYGLLKGVGTQTDEAEALKIMESLLGVYARDADTAALQGEIAYELMLYYLTHGDGRDVARYEYLAYELGDEQTLYGLGTRYADGNLLPKDEAAALRCLRAAAGKGHVPSMRLAADVLLGKKRIEGVEAERYDSAVDLLITAARAGDIHDLLNLIRICWSRGLPEERERACAFLEEEQTEENARLLAFLRRHIASRSYMTVFRPVEFCADGERFGAIEAGGATYALCREPAGERHNNMALLRGRRKICDFFCSAWGFGDIDSFDLEINGHGEPVVHSAEFDRYGGETLFCDHYVFQPAGGQAVLVCNHLGDEWLPGRRMLKYTSY